MIRVADYIARRIAEAGVKQVFMLTGGGAMHLNDAIGRSPDLTYVACHHEQACAIAAEGYARITEGLGAVCVTTGPGGTNTMTGLLGSWLDSIPVIYISGQVRYDTTVAGLGLSVRQVGDQEADIIAIVKTLTKYAVLVTEPQTIRYHLEKALWLAQSGRPGPVWLDIPLNVQAAMVDEEYLEGYNPVEDRFEFDTPTLKDQLHHLIERLKTAQRPVLWAGSGIRQAGGYAALQEAAHRLDIPVLTAWDAIDLLPSSDPLYAGRPGPLGQRAANLILQNSDLLLSVGCLLNIRHIGFTFASVARAAYKVVVDVDAAELEKPFLKLDLPIHCDPKLFLERLNQELEGQAIEPKTAWLEWAAARNERYPVVLPEYHEVTDVVNSYVFCEMLSDNLVEDDVIVSSDGSACIVPIQTLKLKPGQRYIVNSGCAAMGYGLPAAVGACFAHGKRVICLEGDGSIQLNIQELQTVVHHQLPLKIFVFNNGGYLSIRTTQRNFFNGNFVGESPASGLSFPDMTKLGQAYGLETAVIHNHQELAQKLPALLQSPGPVLCDLRLSPDQPFMPRVSSQRLPDGRMVSKPLEDMFPFLEREEFLSNMLIPTWDE